VKAVRANLPQYGPSQTAPQGYTGEILNLGGIAAPAKALKALTQRAALRHAQGRQNGSLVGRAIRRGPQGKPATWNLELGT